MDILKNKENTAVQAHINILQGVISKMANNSSNCKTWSITILSAIIVLFADGKIVKNGIWVGYIPVFLFFFLDCFYLGLERHFIRKQSLFVAKINNGEEFSKDIFDLSSESSTECKFVLIFTNLWKHLKNTASSILSFSTLPFYLFMILLIYFLGK